MATLHTGSNVSDIVGYCADKFSVMRNKWVGAPSEYINKSPLKTSDRFNCIRRSHLAAGSAYRPPRVRPPFKPPNLLGKILRRSLSICLSRFHVPKFGPCAVPRVKLGFKTVKLGFCHCWILSPHKHSGRHSLQWRRQWRTREGHK